MMTVELPSDVWNIILENLTNNEHEKDYQYVGLSLISSVSKLTNLLCKKIKQQFGIQNIKVESIVFQNYFALHGYLNCMRYAHENGCNWNEDTCSNAARNGHLECLKYAHENGCNWNDRTCSYAAKNGHLECLKYAHENGCDWNEDTCSGAANNGHLECLKYAHENGCPCDHNGMNF